MVFNKFLLENEINYIRSLKYNFDDGQTDGKTRSRVVQKADILNYFPKLEQRILEAVHQLNNSYRYTIDKLAQMDLLKYEKGGKYDWHQDVLYARSKHRKFSVIIQLSDSKDYKGGDFELRDPYSLDLSTFREKGSMLIFPSFLWHRITPIKSGRRESIVSWIEGPTWK